MANIKHAARSEDGIAEADLQPGLVEHAWHMWVVKVKVCMASVAVGWQTRTAIAGSRVGPMGPKRKDMPRLLPLFDRGGTSVV